MIDIENQVFTKVEQAVTTAFPGCEVLSYSQKLPYSFPCVCIEETDNYIMKDFVDSGSKENVAYLNYDVNVYSAKEEGKKSQCKAIFQVVSNTLEGLGFERRVYTPMATEESSIFRITGRFNAIVDSNETIY